jgi:hypothetical protein
MRAELKIERMICRPKELPRLIKAIITETVPEKKTALRGTSCGRSSYKG